MTLTSFLVERAARKLAAEPSVSRRGLLLGSGLEPESAAAQRRADADAARADRAGGIPTTPQETAALRAILQKAAPTRAELLGLADSLALPGADDRFSADARARLAALRARVPGAKQQASSVRRRSDLRLRLISYLSDAEALLAALAELGTAPDGTRVAALRTRLAILDRRLAATEKQLLPKLYPTKAKKPS